MYTTRDFPSAFSEKKALKPRSPVRRGAARWEPRAPGRQGGRWRRPIRPGRRRDPSPGVARGARQDPQGSCRARAAGGATIPASCRWRDRRGLPGARSRCWCAHVVRPVRPPGGPPAGTVRDPPRLLVILVEQCPGMAGDIPDPSGRHPARDVEPAEAPAAEHRVHRRAGSPEERSQAVGPVPPGGSRGEDLSDDRLRQPARRAMRAARPVLEPRDSICSCGGPRGDDGPS